MIDKFGNAFYLVIYLAHFIIVGSYAYQLVFDTKKFLKGRGCLLYTSPSPRDVEESRMPSSA